MTGRWCSCNIKHWAGSDWLKDAKRATINRAENTACSEATNSPAIVRLVLSERPEPQEPPTKGSTEITSSRQMSLQGSVSIDSSSVAAAANDQNWASRNAAVQNIRISRLDEFNIYLNLCVSLSQIMTLQKNTITQCATLTQCSKDVTLGLQKWQAKAPWKANQKTNKIKSPPKEGRAFKNLPEVGLEPTHSCLRLILSQLRLPFRHSGITAE